MTGRPLALALLGSAALVVGGTAVAFFSLRSLLFRRPS